jgi:hypothetical protein
MRVSNEYCSPVAISTSRGPLRRETRNRDGAAAYPAALLTPVRAILLVVDRVLVRLEVLAAVRALPHPRWRIGSLLHRHLFSGVL